MLFELMKIQDGAFKEKIYQYDDFIVQVIRVSTDQQPSITVDMPTEFLGCEIKINKKDEGYIHIDFFATTKNEFKKYQESISRIEDVYFEIMNQWEELVDFDHFRPYPTNLNR